MKIKWGALVTDGRGKIGGQIASRNKSGAYLKNLVIPNNPQTDTQQEQRSRMSTFAQSWRILTQAQRDAWKAASENFPVINNLGDVIHLAGNMLYNMLNLNLQKVNITAITMPPSPVGAGTPPTTSTAASAGAVIVTLGNVVPNGFRLLISATPSFSPGIGNYKNKLRNVFVAELTSGAIVDITAEYTDKFGDPIAGQKVGFSFAMVNVTTGESSVPTKEAVIAT